MTEAAAAKAAADALVERFDIEPYMIKLYRARSLLYRRQLLQENIRWSWKALGEIYKIYMLLHRSDLNISAKSCETLSHFRQNFAKFRHFRKKKIIKLCSDFDENLSEFRHILSKMLNIPASLKFSDEFQQNFLNSDQTLI